MHPRVSIEKTLERGVRFRGKSCTENVDIHPTSSLRICLRPCAYHSGITTPIPAAERYPRFRRTLRKRETSKGFRGKPRSKRQRCKAL